MTALPRDQAAELRSLMASMEMSRPAAEAASTAAPQRAARVVAIASGKGGVGKTHIAVNLAVLLAQRGRRIALIDADIGTANIDVVLNVCAAADLSHVLRGERALSDTAIQIQPNLQLYPGASGMPAVADLGAEARRRVTGQFAQLETDHDLILIDCGAGVSQNVLAFAQAADELLIVTTPEPTALTDAYALIKVLSRAPRTPPMATIVNQCRATREGDLIAERLASVAARFLRTPIEHAGVIVTDPNVGAAVRRRAALVAAYPRSPAATCLSVLASRFDQSPRIRTPEAGFFRRVFAFFN